MLRALGLIVLLLAALPAAVPAAAGENKGFVGERYDADAGLQCLNARYYDPRLGLFLQPDWFEVTQPGVGTNRFSYAFNDPVNKMDPGGNCYASGPFPAAAGCSTDPLENLLASLANLPANTLNVLLSPLTATGALLEPHEGTITNFALTTPMPHDDLGAGVGKMLAASARASVANQRAAMAAYRIVGRVENVNERMSRAARAYQARVTGMQQGTAFVQNGVRFDGVDLATGTLLEAKSGMGFMVRADGQFKSWANFPDQAVAQALRQLEAANGARVEWRVQSEKVADALRNLFKDRNIDIDVKHVE